MFLRPAIAVMVLVLFCLTPPGEGIPSADEGNYRLGHRDVFGKLRRAPAFFPHRLHEEALDSEGCGVCHHELEEQTGRLVWVEDEEVSCKECHGRVEKDAVRALREAYHASCTVCHRASRKGNAGKGGPVTCGECHTESAYR